jgi:hypothetical protein
MSKKTRPDRKMSDKKYNNKNKPFPIRLTPEERLILDELAESLGKNRSEVIKEVFFKYIEPYRQSKGECTNEGPVTKERNQSDQSSTSPICRMW